jgi:polyhydroxybutyrate depolymerase
MKKGLFRTILLSIFLLFIVSFAQYDTLNYDGIDRIYLLHVPSSYDGLSAVPLVVALHGYSGNGAGLESLTGFSVKANSNNFIVVYPDGTGSTRSWNAGNCCGQAMTNNVDDVGFISALIDTLSANYNIDSTRIYATGFSNGSMMSYRLAAELSDKIAAIAGVAGQMVLDDCDPVRALPIMHLHALDDGVVLYEGSSDGFIYPSVEAVIDIWVEINGCDTVPDTIIDNSGILMVRKWAAQTSNADVFLYTRPTGGHTWPTGTVSATDSIWDFFVEHPMDPATGVDDNNNPETVKNFSLKQNYPNLFDAATTISFFAPYREKVTLKVFDLLGNEVAILLNKEVSAGEHRVIFESKNLPAGVYLYRLQAGKSVDAKKLVILR